MYSLVPAATYPLLKHGKGGGGGETKRGKGRQRGKIIGPKNKSAKMLIEGIVDREAVGKKETKREEVR